MQWDSLQTPAARGPTVPHQGNEQVTAKSIHSVSPLFPRAAFPLLLSLSVCVNVGQHLQVPTLPGHPSLGSAQNQGVDVAAGDVVLC